MEYATRDQAQAAINTLSNQNLMGRLVYVREVSCNSPHRQNHADARLQDRETEPRFTNPAPARGGYDGGYGGRGGYGGGYGGGPMGGGIGMQGRGGNQIFVSNVCTHSTRLIDVTNTLRSFRSRSVGKISRIFSAKQVSCIGPQGPTASKR